MMEKHMTWSLFETLVTELARSGRVHDFMQSPKRRNFVLLRHDVDFSIERNAHMLGIERKHEVQATYCFLIDSPSYNPLSAEVQSLFRDIVSAKCHIGLHYRYNDNLDPEENSAAITRQLKTLSDIAGTTVDRFSFHCPSKKALNAKIAIPNAANCYGPEFFSFYPDEKVPQNPPVKYIADSNYSFPWGFPDHETLEAHDKIQVLIHADNIVDDEQPKSKNRDALLREKLKHITRDLNSMY
ncbi:MAG: hypothetical protein LBS17_01255 [Actinomycetes bacterium]|jgi:hypothetical protein|nr:hypothetical protein [Actinomycetes bacterium]